MSTFFQGGLLHCIVFPAATIIIQGAVFMPLEDLFASKPSQPRFRRDMITDVLFCFFAALVIVPLNRMLLSYLRDSFPLARPDLSLADQASLFPGWPVLLQIVAALAVVDFIQYWVHRSLLHGKKLWKIHAIHHCTLNVDWMSNYRAHPINFVLLNSMVMDIVNLFGFNYEQSALVTLFYNISTCLVHANLNWTYGPFRYVLVSPIMHRWHHTSYTEGGNKNFATIFPLFDLIFGTFYMPMDKKPMQFGAPDDPVPSHFLGQLAYPFVNHAAQTQSSGSGTAESA